MENIQREQPEPHRDIEKLRECQTILRKLAGDHRDIWGHYMWAASLEDAATILTHDITILEQDIENEEKQAIAAEQRALAEFDRGLERLNAEDETF